MATRKINTCQVINTHTNETELIGTVKQIAKHFNVSENHVRGLLSNGYNLNGKYKLIMI